MSDIEKEKHIAGHVEASDGQTAEAAQLAAAKERTLSC